MPLLPCCRQHEGDLHGVREALPSPLVRSRVKWCCKREAKRVKAQGRLIQAWASFSPLPSWVPKHPHHPHLSHHIPLPGTGAGPNSSFYLSVALFQPKGGIRAARRDLRLRWGCPAFLSNHTEPIFLQKMKTATSIL